MQMSGNAVLVTGGASGIGLGIVERFLWAGSRVLLCGRRSDRLEAARQKHPGVSTRVCDLSHEADRRSLVDWALEEAPGLNVLVNNAGIQLRLPLTEKPAWDPIGEEIAINLHAPIHLAMLLAPHLVIQPRAAILNVTSGLAFSPLANVPVYSATKAALHSFTLTLRRQLEGTSVEVIEIIPPAVDTDLGGPGLHKFGVNLDEFLNAVWPKLEGGANEVAYGFSQQSSQASRSELDQMFKRMNAAKS